MKFWMNTAMMFLPLLLAQGQRALSDNREMPPRPPLPDESTPELPADSAIRCPIVPAIDEGAVQMVAFSPDGKSIAAVNNHGVVKVFDVRSGLPIVSFRPAGSGSLRGNPVVFTPDGGALAAPIASGQWALFGPASGRMLRPMEPHPGILDRSVRDAVAFSPDGKWLAGSYDTGEVVIWEVASGKRHRVLPPIILPPSGVPPASPRNPVSPARPARVSVLAFSPDGGTLYTAGDKVRAWDVAHTLEPRRLDLPEELPCGQLAVSTDGATLAVAVGSDSVAEKPHSIVLLDAAGGRRKGEITTRTTAIRGLSFLPGGKLVSLEGERDIRLWDITTAKPVAACRFEKHFRLEDLAVSPDGRRIAASGQESDAIFGVIGMVETDGVTLGPWRPATP